MLCSSLLLSSGGDRAEAAGNERLERAAQRVARKTLQAFGEVVDPEQEQAQSTQEFHDGGGVRGLQAQRFSRSSGARSRSFSRKRLSWVTRNAPTNVAMRSRISFLGTIKLPERIASPAKERSLQRNCDAGYRSTGVTALHQGQADALTDSSTEIWISIRKGFQRPARCRRPSTCALRRRFFHTYQQQAQHRGAAGLSLD